MNFSKNIQLGNKQISELSPTFIIAEAGVNHDGDINLARKLVDIAVAAGADAVKFQAFRTKNLIIENVRKAPYQLETTSTKETQTDMLRKLELKVESYVELKTYCAEKGILFLITPFDEQSLEELCDIGVEAFKIASTDATNLPFLRKLAMTRKPLILSTGMCYLAEVRTALEEIYPHNKDVILLQCTANYPIADSEANLRILNTYKENFNALVGYSDHSVGLGASLFAVPMGAKIIEKHFTIDKSAEGPDHRASLSPEELNQFVVQIRKIEEYLGSGTKEPTPSEVATRKSLQKALVARGPILKGHDFTEANLVAKRTGGEGLSPICYHELVGRKASRDYHVDDIISTGELDAR